MSQFWAYILVFLVSAVPVIELRGAIPMGVNGWGTALLPTFIVAVLGAFLPSAFIIVSIREVLHKLENSKINAFQRYGAWLRKKGERGSRKVNKVDPSERIAELRASNKPRDHRHADRLEKQSKQEHGKFGVWSFIALLVFVAIPLPGTGVWTGSIVAGMLDLRLKQALPAIFIGNLIAGLIMLLFSHGLNVVL